MRYNEAKVDNYPHDEVYDEFKPRTDNNEYMVHPTKAVIINLIKKGESQEVTIIPRKHVIENIVHAKAATEHQLIKSSLSHLSP